MSDPGHTPLGAGREFDIVRAVWRRLGNRVAPSGDDCTLVTVGGERLALTSDLAIEGVHFERGWLSMEEIGWRATMAALSDVAAVAAEPVGVLVSLGVSDEWPEDWTVEIMEGVGQAAAAVGARVLGGDLVRSPILVIDVSCLARAPRPVVRGGAAPGQVVCVTGALGGPAAALSAWQERREPDARARARFARPMARVEEAAWLSARGATALIDISDGLLADASHVAAASGLAIELEADRVPVHPAASPEQALVSGEEYELLVVLDTARADGVAHEMRAALGQECTRIGRTVPGSGVRLLRDGASVPLPDGFAHFS